MATQFTNFYKEQLLKGKIDFSTHTIKAILMGSSFAYNSATHDVYADVEAYELATGNGYTHGGAVLADPTVTRDDTAFKAATTWNPVTWTAGGGDIGPAVGIILYDDTHADKAIIGFLDFGAQKTTLDGGVFSASNIKVEQL